MGQLNLYKIDPQKLEEFKSDLIEKYDSVGDKQLISRMINDQEVQFQLSLFIKYRSKREDLTELTSENINAFIMN